MQAKLDFKKIQKIIQNNLECLPVVVQDTDTKRVIMLAYVNQESLDISLKTKKATFWSTSRNKLWIKGDTSGNYLNLKEVLVNCEDNSLLFLVNLAGSGACHKKDAQGKYRFSCYYRKLDDKYHLEEID